MALSREPILARERRRSSAGQSTSLVMKGSPVRIRASAFREIPLQRGCLVVLVCLSVARNHVWATDWATRARETPVPFPREHLLGVAQLALGGPDHDFA